MIRPANNYGAFQQPEKLIPYSVANLIHDKNIEIYGEGKQIRHWLHVEDTVEAILTVIDKGKENEIYNVGSGVQTSIAELCELILKLKQSNLRVQYSPYSEDDARRLVQNRIGCPEKASNDLGFNYTYSLEEGLQKLITWRDKKK